MLLSEDGADPTCDVGLGSDVVKHALARARGSDQVLVTYEGTDDDELRWGLGLGCGDAVDVLIERLDASAIDPVRFIEGCHRLQRRGAMVTVFRSDDASVRAGARLTLAAGGASTAVGLEDFARERLLEHARTVLASGMTRVMSLPARGGSMDVLVEAIIPPPQLFLFGTSRDAASVAQLASALDWDVLVCEPCARIGCRVRFPTVDAFLTEGEAVVAARIAASERPVAAIMTHDWERDRAAFEIALASHARYIGVVGPRARTSKLLADLGLSMEQEPRVHTPLGISGSADSPGEVALAVVSEIQSVLDRTFAGTHARPERAQAEVA
jgi:xanthine dehydrogenase accessory factor